MTRRVVGLRFLTKKPLTKEPLGRQLLTYLFERYPEIKPEYTSFYDPVNVPITDVESALEYWWKGDFYARRRSNPKGDWSSGIDIKQNSRFNIDLTWSKKIPWYEIFCEIQKILTPYHAHIHLFTPTEKEIGYERGLSAYCNFRNSLVGVKIEREGIHDLGWANYFGGHFLEILPPLDAIRDAGAQVIPQGDGYIIRFSDDIADMLTGFESFDQHRTAVKALFPAGTFQPYTND
tara:strand:+ start:967 stop:1668 length:702 start_codon:yes stop_codon:yes gene_type:complete